MSWAEVKKAVNSNLDVPLNDKVDNAKSSLADMFGLEYVTQKSIPCTVSNTNGFAFVTSSTDNSSVSMNGKTICAGNYGGGYSSYNLSTLTPLTKNMSYSFNSSATYNGGTVTIYSFGGGI